MGSSTSSYPTTTPPGRFGRPCRNSKGHASSPLYEQAGWGGFATRAHPSVTWRYPQRAGTTVHIQSPTPWRKRMLSRSEKHGQRIAPQPTAGASVGLRAHNARRAHTNRVRAVLRPSVRVRPT
eukprot:3222031-Prymnesium_polylepis.1